MRHHVPVDPSSEGFLPGTRPRQSLRLGAAASTAMPRATTGHWSGGVTATRAGAAIAVCQKALSTARRREAGATQLPKQLPIGLLSPAPRHGTAGREVAKPSTRQDESRRILSRRRYSGPSSSSRPSEATEA